jgi:hypothetical protein
MVVAIAGLDVAAAYKYRKPGPTVRIIIEEPTQNAGAAGSGSGRDAAAHRRGSKASP